MGCSHPGRKLVSTKSCGQRASSNSSVLEGAALTVFCTANLRKMYWMSLAWSARCDVMPCKL